MAGSYLLAVTLSGAAIMGSPFPVFVAPGPVLTENAQAFGAGVVGATAGLVHTSILHPTPYTLIHKP